MSVGFRRGRPERASGRIGVLSLLPDVPPGDIGSGNPITGTRGETVTVTRATTRFCYSSTTPGSTATVASVAVNAPALEANGLSIEAAHTNIVLRSQEFNTVPWATQEVGVVAPTVTANAATAPDGTLTADQLAFPAVSLGGNYSLLHSNSITVSNGTPYTISLWVKGASGSGTVYLSVYDATWTTTAVTYTTAWRRFTLTRTASGTIFDILIGVDLRDVAQATQPAQTVHVWGAQLETGAYPHSYRPTTSAAATTNADVAVMSGHGSLPVASGTLEFDFTPLWSTTPVGAVIIIDTRLDSGGGGISVYSLTDAIGLAVNAAAPVQSAALTWVAGTTYRIKATWRGGTVSLYRDGVLAVSGASIMPTTHSQLRIGNNFGGGFQSDANIKNMRWYR